MKCCLLAPKTRTPGNLYIIKINFVVFVDAICLAEQIITEQIEERKDTEDDGLYQQDETKDVNREGESHDEWTRNTNGRSDRRGIGRHIGMFYKPVGNYQKDSNQAKYKVGENVASTSETTTPTTGTVTRATVVHSTTKTPSKIILFLERL